MFRKFILYFLYYIPIFKSLQVKLYSEDIIDNLANNQLIISANKYWMKDSIEPHEVLMVHSLKDFPQNLILILTDSRYYRYIHYVRNIISQSYNYEIFDVEKPKVEKFIITEYLEAHLFIF